VQEDAVRPNGSRGEPPKRPIRHATQDVLSQTAQALKMAQLLASSITANHPAGILAQATQRLREDTMLQWAREFSDINKIDGRSWPEIERAITLSQRSGHWQTVVLGPCKLREHWDAINV
jgi:hypothetical protein